MSSYIQAREALERIHAELDDAERERDGLHGAVKAIHAAALEADPHLALDRVRRLTTQTLKAWDARREGDRG